MTEQHTPSPRSRLQALLAIPDNQRTEEQWDELHELEITLAPGNRIGHQEKQNPPGGQGKNNNGRGGNPRAGGPRGENRGGENRGGGRGGHPPRPPKPNQPRPVEGPPAEGSQEVAAGDGPAKKPFRRFHKRPPKPAES